MKSRTLAAALIASGFFASFSPCFAHGGQPVVPGDTVPPGIRPIEPPDPSGGARPPGPTSAPSGPAAAGPATAPPAAGPARPRTGAAANAGFDLTLWSYWWEFNKEPYLNLKSAVHAGDVLTGSDGWFIGQGQKRQGRDSLRPTEQQIRREVVPALVHVLETETNNDIVTGALIALAKIGDVKTESGGSRFERILSAWLASPVQEISETAAVSLGILANDASIPKLAHLLKDSPEGRKLVGSSEVSYRTRSFAAYGLALIGAKTGREDLRREIVRHLREVLETDETSARDLSVACLIALGLVPLETIESPAVEGEAKGLPPPETSRVAQIEYVLAYLRDDGKRFLVRAHAPTALVRLTRGLPPELYEESKRTIARELMLLAAKRSRAENEIKQSCVLALGLLGDDDDDAIDRKIRTTLTDIPTTLSDQQTRSFALIALAKAAGNTGRASSGDGIAEVAEHLLEQLSRGKSTQRPWAGVAIGVLGRELALGERAPATVAALTQALHSSLDAEGNSQRVGAYAVGAGILGDPEAEPILRDKLARLRDDEARGYVAVALGLMNARRSIGDVQRVVRRSKYRPELLKQAAIGLGLLGDKEIVPDLVAMLKEAKGLASQAAIARALGFIGDQRSIDPLVEMLGDQDFTPTARGMAAVALGIVADKEALPWNAKIGIDLNYRASTQTLIDQAGTGVLNIL